MSQKDRNKRSGAAGSGAAVDRRQFLGGAALGAAGLGAAFAGLSRTVVAQNAPAAGAPGAGAPPAHPPEPTVSQPPPLKNLKGKTAYITASSDGIGLGIARACSNAGMKVVIGYRNEERLKAALPLFKPSNAGVHAIKHDVTDRDGWTKLVEEINGKFGNLHLVVNNAGMKVVIGYRNEERLKAALPLFKPGNAGVHAIKHDVTDRDGWTKLVEEINGKFGNLHLVVNNAGVKTLRQASQAKFDEWDNAVAVNFTAIYNSVAACLPHMLKHGEGGHFVTTASMGGLLPGSNAGVYTTTKIAAVGIMEALRVELESTSVGTSVFCPGLVSTDNYPMGEENPFRAAQAAQAGRPAPAGMPAVGMDPLEAGERVLHGVVNNDLFILTHPEFKPGIQERCDAIMASTPSIETPIPQARIDSERVVMRCGIYAREIAHRKGRRKSYRAI